MLVCVTCVSVYVRVCVCAPESSPTRKTEVTWPDNLEVRINSGHQWYTVYLLKIETILQAQTTYYFVSNALISRYMSLSLSFLLYKAPLLAMFLLL